MPLIDTTLLILGGGPAALVAAKVASGWGVPSLVVGHEPTTDAEPAAIDERSLAILRDNGVLDVLRPYATHQDPFTIVPSTFERALKHHCVADTLITVYDDMVVSDLSADGAGVRGALCDRRRSWEVRADALLDVSGWPRDLSTAVHLGAAAAEDIVGRR